MSGELLPFLAAVRRRLWLEVLLRRLHPAVWLAGAVLLAAGSANLAWVPVPWPGAAAAAGGAALLVLLPALWARPPLAQCALRADRRLGGQSLLTTALEVLRRPAPERGAAGTALLRRAAGQSALWRPRLAGLRNPAPITGLAAALVPAFAGLVLLQATPAQRDHASASETRDVRAADGDAAPAGPADFNGTGGVDLVALRGSLGAPDPSPTATAPPGAGAPALRPAHALPSADARVAALEAGAPPPPGRAAATDDAGTEPGTAHRSLEDAAGSSADTALPATPRVGVAVPRTGDAAAASTATNRRFGEGHEADSPSRAVQPAAAPPAAGAWTNLTAAEVAYARRYLDAHRQARD